MVTKDDRDLSDVIVICKLRLKNKAVLLLGMVLNTSHIFVTDTHNNLQLL